MAARSLRPAATGKGPRPHVEARGMSGGGEGAARTRRATTEMGPGSPLPARFRSDMEGAAGTDFSLVRLHADEAAHRSASGLGTPAYTVGEHIVAARGHADPGT